MQYYKVPYFYLTSLCLRDLPGPPRNPLKGHHLFTPATTRSFLSSDVVPVAPFKLQPAPSMLQHKPSSYDYAIAHLPGKHHLPPLHTLDGDQIDKLTKAIDFSTKSELQTHIDSWSKLSLLRHHLEPKEEGPGKAVKSMPRASIPPLGIPKIYRLL
ncbi:hypothetical protein F5877DRAFT_83083 [Lentinula edodes]|nr:hypothetical protein F5877DRAFT_83083 [Lentinula edodes]